MRSNKPQSKKNHQPPPGGFSTSTSGNKKKITIFVAAIIITLLAFLVFNSFTPTNEPSTAIVNNDRTTKSAEFLSMPAGSGVIDAKTASEREQQKKQLQMRFDEVSKTFCSYRESTKYPNSSRPISQHPDQVYPNQPIKETHPMRNSHGGTDKNIQIQTSQSRVYLSSKESVDLSLRALDASGNSLPLIVEGAAARGLRFGDSRPAPQVAIKLADDGKDSDQVAGDGISSARLTPGASPFANFDGTIRIEVNYSVNGSRGMLYFDVIYTPEVPAVWTGKVRETVENGDLKFFLPVSVKVAGRYLVSARVDDAKGKPFAYLSFNDLLAVGNAEIPLNVAGKLLRDGEASFPLSLRDIDAYLLKENVDPDRALMARLEGQQHVSKSYSLKVFSDAEWESEERSRYLKEFSKDLEQARTALTSIDPGLARTAKIQDPCSNP